MEMLGDDVINIHGLSLSKKGDPGMGTLKKGKLKRKGETFTVRSLIHTFITVCKM